MSGDVQFDWDGSQWTRCEVGDEPSVFALGVLADFAYISVAGEDGDNEFFTLGSNPGLAFGEAEWIFAQDDPDYVARCLDAPQAKGVIDKYLSRLDDESSRGEPRAILDELVAALGIVTLPW